MKNERYYYSIMKDYEREAYKLIYDGIINRSYEIYITNIYNAGELQVIYLKLLFDNPLFYYVNQRVIKLIGEPLNFCLMPEYLYSEKEIGEINFKLKNIVDIICNKARTLDNEFRKEKFLHDSIIKSVAYDNEALIKDDCYDSHSIIGVFFHKRAVCEGIAKAFKLLCNEIDIKCIVVIGKASQERDFDKETFHAWNIVKIEGESYYVDVTWDNTFQDDFMHISYDYFNITTSDIKIDHIPEEEMPCCDSRTYNYFYYMNSFVSSYTELKEFIKGRLAQEYIMFKVRMPSCELGEINLLQRSVYQALDELAGEIGNKVRPCRILFNEVLLIGKIYFT